MQLDPPQVPHSDGPPGAWDSLTFGADEPPSPRRRKVLIGLVAAGALVAAGLGTAEFVPRSTTGSAGPEPRIITLTPHPAPPSTYLSMDGSTRPLLKAHPLTAATRPPTGLGDEPAFDRFARECSRGAMRACDQLYDLSAPGSPYEDYADTCAGRQPRNTNLYCVVAFRGS